MGLNKGMDFVVDRKKLGVRSDGCEYELVVISHPNGKLYQFEFSYNSEFGIYPCLEDPDDMIEAVEVEAVETVTTTYRPVVSK